MKPRVLLSVLALAGLPLSGWAADARNCCRAS